MKNQNCQNWAVEIKRNEHSEVPEPLDSCYLKYQEDFPKDKLVYLTADSENLATNLDPTDIFIIGGIVDHNRHKLLTLNKANA